METQSVQYVGSKEGFDQFIINFVNKFIKRKTAGQFADCVLFVLRVVNGVEVFKIVVAKQLPNETLKQTGERIGILNYANKPVTHTITEPNTQTINNITMNTDKRLVAINKAIKELTAAKAEIENATGFHREVEALGRGTWIIEDNRYFQFDRIEGDKVVINRKGVEAKMTFGQFNSMFRLASAFEAAQHELYLKNSGGKQISDKVFVGYKLSARFKANERPAAVLAGYGATLPKFVPSTSQAWVRIQHAGIESWFEEAYVETLIKPAVKPAAFDPKNCEFYMVTCKGVRGAKHRHTSYGEALTQAKQIAQKENHPAWVVGVVAMVNP